MSMSLAPAPMSPLLSDGAPPLGDSEFAAIARIMMTEARISLPSTKKVLVHSRLSRRLRERRLASFKDYIAFAENDAEELRLLVTALTTNQAGCQQPVRSAAARLCCRGCGAGIGGGTAVTDCVHAAMRPSPSPSSNERLTSISGSIASRPFITSLA